MATIEAHHRSLSQYIFPSSAPPPSPRETKAFQSQRRPTASHYRPFSQVLSEDSQEAARQRSAKLSRRNSIQLFMTLSGFPLRDKVSKSKAKGKGKGKEGEREKEREREREKGVRLRKLSSHASAVNQPNPFSDNEHPLPLRRGLSNKASVNSLHNVIDISPRRNENTVVLRTEDTFVKKRVWHRHGSMAMHPYPADAVYMQSYDPVMLENEKYSYLLLRRLTSSIPTFSTSMEKPPSDVLDLGCGQGHWILDAANHWPSAEFTGFDLVDIMLPEIQERSNVKLVRGNFVKYRLPFPDKSFDFVRMANLTLAIPHERWSFVMCEARRVLKTGGQLEVIDDQICFPYGAFPVITPPSSPSSLDSHTPPGPQHRRANPGGPNSNTSSPTLKGSEIADSDCTLIDDVVTKYKPEASSPPPTMGTQRRSLAYLQQWATGRQVSRDVEETFLDMLRKRFVHPSPKDFVPDLLRYIFGSGNVSNTQTYTINLAPLSSTQSHRIDPQGDTDQLAQSDQSSLGDVEETNQSKSRSNSRGSDDDSSPTRATFPAQHSAKAAGRLGISYSDLIAATASAKRPTSPATPSYHYPTARGSRQSPGIIVLPSTFIPLTPTETEFHASKWIHTVLGCRPSIFDYVRSQTDEAGKRLVSDAELKDALWTYECFRRQRFHWPTDVEHNPDDFNTPCIANTRKLNFQWLFEGRDEPTHIRTIQVYHATKTDITSLASLLFSPPSEH